MPAQPALDPASRAASILLEDPPRRAWLRRRGRQALALALGASALPIQAQGPVAPEAQVKAAYLVKFPGFVDWPSTAFRDASSPFVIAYAGAPGIVQELQNLASGRRVQGRALEVRGLDLRAPPTPTALQDVQLLFIGAAARREAAAWIAACRELPVLIVTEAPWGLPAGAMLNFVNRDGHVRFEAARVPAERAGLKLSARLLTVAERVVEASS